MNNVNQLINIILTTFIFYYLVNEVFKIDLFNITNVETLETLETYNNVNKTQKSEKANSDKQELVDMINELEDDINSDEIINADYKKYIKSEDLNIGDLIKREQIYNQQLNKCELTSTDLIEKNIDMATISNDDKSYTMNGFDELDAFDNSNSYSSLK